jgi:pimeloyl-ACP methyl ester carboxylesterase
MIRPSTNRLAVAAMLTQLALVSPAHAQPKTQGKQQAAPAASTQPEGEPAHRDATFKVFLAGRPVGSQTVLVDVSDTEWRVRTTGQLTPPLAFTLRAADIRYDRQWHPLGFTMDATLKDQTIKITTTFANGKAESQVLQGDQVTTKSDAVSASTIILPNSVYGAFEAVVARLGGAPQPGLRLPIYVTPSAETTLTLESSEPERVQTPGRVFQSRHYTLSIANPNGPVKIELWADDRGHLMRLRIPAVSLEVTRDDIATIATREETAFRANDENVNIPANGFNLAATVSKPASAPAPAPVKGKPARLPAIVLVGGSGPTDRNENVFGIPIFQQLGNALADAGYIVVRYDRRGVGQSGGRPESATLADYAEDLRAAVRYLTTRKDVDDDRIAVAGHSEGAAVALIAAKDEKKIRAIISMAGIGMTGAELNLEQQRYVLSRSKMSDEEKQTKIELQKKIQAATLSGQGWDGIPLQTRRAADTPWFRSFLQFDPAAVLKDVRQPILIIQGELDKQIPPQHADRLAELAKARKKAAAADVQEVKLPGINHLLVPAKTGDIDEYASLAPKTITPDVAAKIVEWLQPTLAAKK